MTNARKEKCSGGSLVKKKKTYLKSLEGRGPKGRRGNREYLEGEGEEKNSQRKGKYKFSKKKPWWRVIHKGKGKNFGQGLKGKLLTA